MAASIAVTYPDVGPRPAGVRSNHDAMHYTDARTQDVIQVGKEGLPMSDQYWISKTQLERIKPWLPSLSWRPRADDRRVISAIIHVIRNGLRWRDVPEVYGPHKTLYNRFMHWSRLGVFDRIFAALAGEGPEPERIMIDATHLKAHRTAASLQKRGMFPIVSGAPRVD
jgi:putative transposase